MRPRPDWLNAGPDDQILELLAETNLELTTRIIFYNVDYGYEYVRDRITELTRRGLLEKPDDKPQGYYRITETGRQYLRGELTKEQMENL